MLGGGVLLGGDMSQRELNASVGTLRNSRAIRDQLQTELSPCSSSNGPGVFLIFWVTSFSSFGRRSTYNLDRKGIPLFRMNRTRFLVLPKK
jgi:hypothetical protein